MANLTASRVSTEPMRKLRVFAPPLYFSIDMHARSVTTHRLVRDGLRSGRRSGVDRGRERRSSGPRARRLRRRGAGAARSPGDGRGGARRTRSRRTGGGGDRAPPPGRRVGVVRAGGRVGLVGGSGVYDLASIADLSEERVETPFGSPSDSYFTGTLEGVPVAFLSRHGRGHRICAHPRSTTGPTSAASRCSAATRCCPPRPAGACARSSRRATRSSPTSSSTGRGTAADSFFGDGVVAHAGLADPVCPELARGLAEGGRAAGLTVHGAGPTCAWRGPQFSTRAESNLYRSWGADVIGMTNLTEARLCREAEICYASLALVTDYDCWREATEDGLGRDHRGDPRGERGRGAPRAVRGGGAGRRGARVRLPRRHALRNHHGPQRGLRRSGEAATESRSRGGTCEDGRPHRRHRLGGVRLPDDVSRQVHRAPHPGPDVAPLGLVPGGRDAPGPGRVRAEHRLGTRAAGRAAGAARDGGRRRGRVPGAALRRRASTCPAFTWTRISSRRPSSARRTRSRTRWRPSTRARWRARTGFRSIRWIPTPSPSSSSLPTTRRPWPPTPRTAAGAAFPFSTTPASR